ncbi:MAG: 50S ribosomal protein L10 [Coriobacteriales bacterium]
MPAQSKIDKVAEIQETIDGANAMWLVDYRGLTVKQVQELRRNLREVEAEMKVYKNNLVKIALANLDLPVDDDLLSGPNGFVFSHGDMAASAKAVKTFMADNEQVEFKGGLLNGEVLEAEKVMAIADLPSHDELIAKLLGTLSNPTTKLVRTLSEIPASFVRTLGAIADQKKEAA